MALESIRGYVQLASGVGDLTRARAMEAARGLLSLPGGQGAGRVTGQVTAVADELLAAATANRENLSALVRAEVEAAVGRLGLTPAKEVAQLRAEVDRLRQENAALVAERAGRVSPQEQTRRATAPRTRKKAASTTTEPATKRATKSASRTAAKSAAKSAAKGVRAASTTRRATDSGPTPRKAAAQSAAARRASTSPQSPSSGPRRRGPAVQDGT